MTGRIPFNKPCVVGSELANMQAALDGGHISGDGSFSRRCEGMLRDRFVRSLFYLTNSCTSALEICAHLCDVSDDTRVILPAFTHPSTASAFFKRGAKLEFVDIQPDTLNMDPGHVAQVIAGGDTVIVPVHYAGVACDMDQILDMARRHGSRVVEDAAQAFGARYRDRELGTLGDCGTFSFHETKNISCGEGGAVTVRHPAWQEKLEALLDKGTDRARFLRGEVAAYTWVEAGSAYRMPDLLAAYLCAQLQSEAVLMRRRAEQWRAYAQGLAQLADEGLIELPFVPGYARTNHHIFYVLTQDRDVRDALLRHLDSAGIGAVFHYSPLHLSSIGRELGYRKGMLPVTERASETIVRLPMFHELAPADIERIVGQINYFYSKSGRTGIHRAGATAMQPAS